MGKFLLLLCLTLGLLLTSCDSLTSSDYGFTDEKYFEEEYQITNSTTTLKIINFDEFKKIKSSSLDYIIALSRPTCDYCQTTIPRLVKALNENEIGEIFFLNTSKLTSNEKSILAGEYQVEGVPTIYFKRKDMPESIITGESTEDELQDKVIEWKGSAK